MLYGWPTHAQRRHVPASPARLLSPHEVQLETVDGACQTLQAETIVLATGSRPSSIPGIPIDHEHVLDSDSILSMIYLPRSLTILGGGVIACEYAATFALLGVEVTIIDRAKRPLPFMDQEIVEVFQRSIDARADGFTPATRSLKWPGMGSAPSWPAGERHGGQEAKKCWWPWAGNRMSKN